MATGKRLTDANGSYTINASDNTDYSLCFGGGIISVMDGCGRCLCEFDAEDAPTVDAAEVVRCKDCVFWKDGYLGCCTKHHVSMEFDDYCSYGERRTE